MGCQQVCIAELFGGKPDIPAVQPIQQVKQPTPVDEGSIRRKQDVRRKALAAASASATGATGPGGVTTPATLGNLSLLGPVAA